MSSTIRLASLVTTLFDEREITVNKKELVLSRLPLAYLARATAVFFVKERCRFVSCLPIVTIDALARKLRQQPPYK